MLRITTRSKFDQSVCLSVNLSLTGQSCVPFAGITLICRFTFRYTVAPVPGRVAGPVKWFPCKRFRAVVAVYLVMQGVAKADPEFLALVRSDYGSLLRTATLITGDAEAARDTVQEAFTRLFVAWGRVSQYDRPGAWVRRVTIRLAARWRTRERARAQATLNIPVVAAGPAPVPGEPDLAVALEVLSPMQRALVVLHYLDDLTIVDAARIVGCNESTARVHLHRARGRLAALLEEESPDDY